MSTDTYLVACVSKFDLESAPTTTPDFYHFKEIDEWKCCEVCDCGERFVSWEKVFEAYTKGLAENFRYPREIFDFKVFYGIE